jgi:hypothetical protein
MEYQLAGRKARAVLRNRHNLPPLNGIAQTTVDFAALCSKKARQI